MPIHSEHKDPKVKGVKMIADGTFHNVGIPHKHPIFNSGTASDVSKMFMDPLNTWQKGKKKSKEAGVSEAESMDIDNALPLTAYLHLNVPKSSTGATSGEALSGLAASEWSVVKDAVLVSWHLYKS